MKFLLIGLILIVVSGCKVLTEQEAKTVLRTLELNRKGFDKLESGEKINFTIVKIQTKKAEDLIKGALDD